MHVCEGVSMYIYVGVIHFLIYNKGISNQLVYIRRSINTFVQWGLFGYFVDLLWFDLLNLQTSLFSLVTHSKRQGIYMYKYILNDQTLYLK